MSDYDYKKAKQIVNDNQDADSIALGMREDISWTASTIWEREKGFLVDLDDPNLTIAGISGSNWATPVAIIYKGEQKILISCYKE